MDVAQLAIRVDSATAVKATSDLERLAVQAGRTDAAADRLAANAGRVGPAMAGAGQNSRMFAMQLSQVAQQASATGNFVQALAIQLPDMTMGFGAAGIAAGVLASVALPVLASALMDSTSATQELQNAMSAMDEAVSDFTSAVEAANVPTEDLIEKYGRLAEVAQRALAAMADVQLVETITAVSDGIAAALDQLTVFGKEGFFLQGDWVRVLRDDFNLTAESAARLTDAIRALDTAQGLEAQAVAADKLQQELLAAFGSVEAMPAPVRAAYQALAQAAASAAEVNSSVSDLPGLLRSAADAAGAVQAAVGGIAGAAATAADAVAGLAQKMWDAAQARMAAEGQLESMQMEFSPAGRALDRFGARSTPTGTGAPAAPRVGRSGGGGGGGMDQYAANLESLVASLETERQTVDQWYAESQAILADRRAQEILGTQAHKDAMLALEVEYQNRVREVEATAQQQRISDTAGFFGSLADIASAGGQKTAKAVAAFQAIEGTINAYGAAIKALNTPGITLAGRFAAYASVLAAGLRGVAAIRAAGGVAGGVGSTGAVAAQGTQQPQLQTVEYMVKGIDRDGIYTGDMIARIFDGITDEAQKRGLQTAIRFI